jgi:hypothetical protein
MSSKWSVKMRVLPWNMSRLQISNQISTSIDLEMELSDEKWRHGNKEEWLGWVSIENGCVESTCHGSASIGEDDFH